MRHPLASASPLPEGLVMRQDQFSVLNYDQGEENILAHQDYITHLA